MPSARAAAAPPARSVGAVRRALHVGVAQRRDVLERAQLVGLLEQRAPHRRLLADRAGDRRLEAAVAAQQVGGGLLADPLRARQPVGRVAAQRDEVRHDRRAGSRSARSTSAAPISSGPSWRARWSRIVIPSPAHWNMSRSPVRICARPPASTSRRA